MAFLRAAGGLLIAMQALAPRVVAQTPVSARPPADTYTHTIAKGDTLIALSQQLLIEPRNWRRLARLNRVRDPRRLRPGRPLLIPVSLMRSLPGQAEVLWLRGHPRIESPAGSGLALLGATVSPGSRIVTGEDEAIGLRLSTGSTVTIHEQARVDIVELRTLAGADVRRTLIDVQRGRVETTVAPSTHPAQRHQIRTPVVTTTVRGTEYRVAVDDASAVTEVTDGVVGLQRDTEDVALPSGFGARARAGVALPQPSALLPRADLQVMTVTTARLPVRLRWPAVPSASAYRVRLSTPADPAPIDDLRVASPEVTWADLADGTYVLAVRAIDGDGLEGLDASAPFVVDARPIAPLVQSNATGPVYGDEVTLAWTRPDGVNAFDVQIASEPTFATPVFERTGYAESRVQVPLPPGQYQWRIASRADGERGPWGDPVTFELRARPPAGPPPQAQVQKRELTLRWSVGMAGDRYGVQMSADPAFTSLLLDTVVNQPELTMPRPGAGRYHVRVRVVNAEGVEGPYGPTQTLDVPRPPRSKWWWLLVPIGAAGAIVAAF